MKNKRTNLLRSETHGDGESLQDFACVRSDEVQANDAPVSVGVLCVFETNDFAERRGSQGRVFRSAHARMLGNVRGGYFQRGKFVEVNFKALLSVLGLRAQLHRRWLCLPATKDGERCAVDEEVLLIIWPLAYDCAFFREPNTSVLKGREDSRRDIFVLHLNKHPTHKQTAAAAKPPRLQ